MNEIAIEGATLTEDDIWNCNGCGHHWIECVCGGTQRHIWEEIKKPTYKFTLKSFIGTDEYYERFSEIEMEEYIQPLNRAFMGSYEMDGPKGWLNDEDFRNRLEERFMERMGGKGWFKDRDGDIWSWNPYKTLEKDVKAVWRKHIKGKSFYSINDAWDKIMSEWYGN